MAGLPWPLALSDVKSHLEANTIYTVTSLEEAFIFASNNGWDATYEGSHDRLSNFRNYSWVQPSMTSFATSFAGQNPIGTECSALTGTTRYHDGAGTYPALNDLIFKLASLVYSPFDGGDNWYHVSISGAVDTTIQINSVGRVVGIKGCQ